MVRNSQDSTDSCLNSRNISVTFAEWANGILSLEHAPLAEMSCNRLLLDPRSKKLASTRLIVWDVISMANKHFISAVDQFFKELTKKEADLGGQILIFASDFRQILPVVPEESLKDQANRCFKHSPLFTKVIRLALSANLRLGGGGSKDIRQKNVGL